MSGFAGSSLGLFGAVWTLFCLVAGALVTDSLLKSVEPPKDVARSPNAGA